MQSTVSWLGSTTTGLDLFAMAKNGGWSPSLDLLYEVMRENELST